MIKVDYTPDVDVFIPPISITINDVDYDGGCVYLLLITAQMLM